MCRADCLSGGGGNDNEVVGYTWTWFWGELTTSFQPSLVGISGGRDTCGWTCIPEMLWLGWKGGLSGGGWGWKAPFPARFKKCVCNIWLNSSEWASKWIEKQILLFPQKSFGLLPLPLFPLPRLPLPKNLIYKCKAKLEYAYNSK